MSSRGVLLKNSGALNFRFQHSVTMTSQRKSPPQAFLVNTFAVYLWLGIFWKNKKNCCELIKRLLFWNLNGCNGYQNLLYIYIVSLSCLAIVWRFLLCTVYNVHIGIHVTCRCLYINCVHPILLCCDQISIAYLLYILYVP